MFNNKIANKPEVIFLIFLTTITIFLRFYQLGYSHFYGDETKTFYLRKDVGAFDWFLDQRKGPVQFAVPWVMEKTPLGSEFNEAVMRFPFALASTLSVLVFYFLVKKLFEKQTSAIASTLFTLNGFFVAFGRTVQYQSFLLLFGFLAILFALYYLEVNPQKRKYYAVISAVFLGLAYLSHYDALFFDIVVGVILIKKYLQDKSILKEALIFYGIPFFVTTAPFYIPFFLKGYFANNTLEYVGRRLTGSNFLKHSSFYTFKVYNPLFENFIPFLFIPFAFKKAFLNENRHSWNLKLLFIWFLIPFLLFEFIFSNPGTHTIHYLIPLIILSAYGIYKTYDCLSNKVLKGAFLVFISYVFLFISISSFFVYLPFLNTGYPWKDSKIGLTQIEKADRSYNLFLYGFPYYRGWEKVRDYHNEKGIRSFGTNDNITIAEFYLNGVSSMDLKDTQMPEYYIEVKDNQENFERPVGVEERRKFDEVLKSYSKEQTIEEISLYKL